MLVVDISFSSTLLRDFKVSIPFCLDHIIERKIYEGNCVFIPLVWLGGLDEGEWVMASGKARDLFV